MQNASSIRNVRTHFTCPPVPCADGDYNLWTEVDLRNNGRTFLNSCPATSQPPIQYIGADRVVQWFLPVTDKENDPITFRLATTAENGGITQYPGVSVNSSTGLVTFDSTLSASGNQHAVVIIISDGSCRAAVDFLAEIVTPDKYCIGCSGGNQCRQCGNDVDCNIGGANGCNTPGAVCVENATPNITTSVDSLELPACAEPGQAIVFTVTATDNEDVCDDMEIVPSDLPPGASFTHSNAPTLNPLVFTFSWTPGASVSGNFPLSFLVRDSAGALSDNKIVKLFVPESGAVLAPPVTSVAKLRFWSDDAGSDLDMPVTGTDFVISTNLNCIYLLEGEPASNTVFTRPEYISDTELVCKAPPRATLDPEGDNIAGVSTNFSVSNAASCGEAFFFTDAPMLYYPRDVFQALNVTAESAALSLRPNTVSYTVTLTRRLDPALDVIVREVAVFDSNLISGEYSVASVSVNGNSTAGAEALARAAAHHTPGAAFVLDNPTALVTVVVITLNVSLTTAQHSQLIPLPVLSASHGFDISEPLGDVDSGFTNPIEVMDILDGEGSPPQWVQVNEPEAGKMSFSGSLAGVDAQVFVPGERLTLNFNLALPFTGILNGTTLNLTLTSASHPSSPTTVAAIEALEVLQATSPLVLASNPPLFSSQQVTASGLASGITASPTSIVIDLGQLSNTAASSQNLTISVALQVAQGAPRLSQASLSAEILFAEPTGFTAGPGSEYAPFVFSYNATASFSIALPELLVSVAADPAGDLDADDPFTIRVNLTATGGPGFADAWNFTLADLNAGLAAYRVEEVVVDGVTTFEGTGSGADQAGIPALGFGPASTAQSGVFFNLTQIPAGSSISSLLRVRATSFLESGTVLAIGTDGMYSSLPADVDGSEQAQQFAVPGVSLSLATKQAEPQQLIIGLDAVTAASTQGQQIPQLVFPGTTLDVSVPVSLPEGTTSAAVLTLTLSGWTGPATPVTIEGLQVVTASDGVSSNVAGGLAALPINGTAILSGGSQAVVPLGDLLNTDSRNAIGENITATLRLVVADVAGLVPGDIIAVSASVATAGLLDPAGVSSGAPATGTPFNVSIGLPVVDITDGPQWSPSPGSVVDAGDILVVSCTIAHSANSTAPAFNISADLSGALHVGLTPVIDVLVNGTSVGAEVAADMNANGQAVVLEMLPLSASANVTILLQVDLAAESGQELPLLDLLVGYSTTSAGSDEAGTRAVPTVPVAFFMAPADLALLRATDDASPVLSIAPVGSVVTVTSIKRFAEGTSSSANLSIAWSSPQQLRYVPGSASAVASPPLSTTALGGDWATVASSAQVVPSGDALLFDLGDVVNNDTQNGQAEFLTLSAQFQVLNNSASVRSGTLLNFTSSFRSASVCDGCARATTNVTVGRPELEISVSPEGDFAALPAGGFFNVSVQLAHAPGSSANAYGIALRDEGLLTMQYRVAAAIVNGSRVTDCCVLNGTVTGLSPWVTEQLAQDDTASLLTFLPALTLGERLDVTLTLVSNPGAVLDAGVAVELSAKYASHPSLPRAENYTTPTAQPLNGTFTANLPTPIVAADIAQNGSSAGIGSKVVFSLPVVFPPGSTSSFKIAIDLGQVFEPPLDPEDVFGGIQLENVSVTRGSVLVKGSPLSFSVAQSQLELNVSSGQLTVTLANVTMQGGVQTSDPTAASLFQFSAVLRDSPGLTDGAVVQGGFFIAFPFFQAGGSLPNITIAEPKLEPVSIHSISANATESADPVLDLAAGDRVALRLRLRHAAGSSWPAYQLRVTDSHLAISQAASAQPSLVAAGSRALYQVPSVTWQNVSQPPHLPASGLLLANATVPLSSASSFLDLDLLLEPASAVNASTSPAASLTVEVWSHPDMRRGRRYLISIDAVESVSTLAMASASVSSVISREEGIGKPTFAAPVATFGTTLAWTTTVALPLGSVPFAAFSFVLAVPNTTFASLSITSQTVLLQAVPGAVPPSPLAGAVPPFFGGLSAFLPESLPLTQDGFGASSPTLESVASGQTGAPFDTLFVQSSTGVQSQPLQLRVGSSAVGSFANASSRAALLSTPSSGAAVGVRFNVTGIVARDASLARGASISASSVFQIGDGAPTVFNSSFDPIRFVEPEVEAFDVSPLAIADVDAGDLLTFTFTLSHASTSDSPLYNLRFVDDQLQHGSVVYSTQNSATREHLGPGVRAYDLARVVVNGTVMFDESSGLDVHGVREAAVESGVWGRLLVLNLGDSVTVELTVRVWDSVSTATVIHPNLEVQWTSGQNVSLSRHYALGARVQPTIAISGPAVSLTAASDASTLSPAEAAVGARVSWVAEIALPEGRSDNLSLNLQLSAALPQLLDRQAGADPILANTRVTSVRVGTGAEGLLSVDTTSCASDVSLAAATNLTGADFPGLAAASSINVNVSDSGDTIDVRVPLCTILNTDDRNNVSHALIVEVEAWIDGGALPTSVPLQGVAISSSLSLLQGTANATLSGASAGNASAAGPVLSVVEPNVKFVSATSSWQDGSAGDVVQTLVRMQQDAAARGNAYHVRLLDLALPLGVVTSSLYQPLSQTSLGHVLLSVEEALASANVFTSLAGEITLNVSSTTGKPVLQAAPVQGEVEYVWRIMDEVLPGMSVRPLLAIQYSTHKDPNNPFARQVGPIVLPLSADANLTVTNTGEVRLLQTTVGPVSDDAAVSGNVQAPTGTAGALTEGQRLQAESILSLPLGTTGNLSLGIPLAPFADFVSEVGDAVVRATVRDASTGQTVDVTSSVRLTDCPSGVLRNNVSQGTFADLSTEAAVLAGGTAMLSMCTVVATPGISGSGRRSAPFSGAASFNLSVALQVTVGSAGGLPLGAGSILANTSFQISSLETAPSAAHQPSQNGSIAPTRITTSLGPRLPSFSVARPLLVPGQLSVRGPTGPDAGDLITFTLSLQIDPNATDASAAYNITITDEGPLGKAYTLNPLAAEGLQPGQVASIATVSPGQIVNVTWTVRLSDSVNASEAYQPQLQVQWVSHPTSESAARFRSRDVGADGTWDTVLGNGNVPAIRIPDLAVPSPAIDTTGLATVGNGTAVAAIGQQLTISLPSIVPEGIVPGVLINISASEDGSLFFPVNATVSAIATPGLVPLSGCTTGTSGTPFAEEPVVSADGSWIAFRTCALENLDRDNNQTESLLFSVQAFPTGRTTRRGSAELSATVTVGGEGSNSSAPASPTPPIIVPPLLQLQLQQSISTPAVSTEEPYQVNLTVTAEDLRLSVPAREVVAGVIVVHSQTEARPQPFVRLPASVNGTVQLMGSISEDAVVAALGNLEPIRSKVRALGTTAGSVGRRTLQATAAPVFDVAILRVPTIQSGEQAAFSVEFAAPALTGVGTVIEHLAVLGWSSAPATAGGVPPTVLQRDGPLKVTISCDATLTCSGNGACLPSNQTVQNLALGGGTFVPVQGVPVADGTGYDAQSKCACKAGWMGGSCCFCDPASSRADMCHGNGVCAGFGAAFWGRPLGGQCQCTPGFNSRDQDPYCRGETCAQSPELCATAKCLSDCAVTPWTNFTAVRDPASGSLTGNMTRNRTILFPDAYGGQQCPSRLQETVPCSLEECLQEPRSAVPLEACDASRTGFRISSSLPLSQGSAQWTATASCVALVLLVAIFTVLWGWKYGWNDRLGEVQWVAPPLAEVAKRSLTMFIVYTNHALPDRLQQVLEALCPPDVLPADHSDDTGDDERAVSAVTPCSSTTPSGDPSAIVAVAPLETQPDPQQPFGGVNLTTVPVSHVLPRAATASYLPPQLWANWRHVLIVALLATDGLMSVAPLFMEQVPWLPYIPAKFAARLLSLTAVKHVPTYSFLFVVVALIIVGLTIMMPLHYQWRRDSIRKLARNVRMQKAGGAAQPMKHAPLPAPEPLRPPTAQRKLKDAGPEPGELSQPKASALALKLPEPSQSKRGVKLAPLSPRRGSGTSPASKVKEQSPFGASRVLSSIDTDASEGREATQLSSIRPPSPTTSDASSASTKVLPQKPTLLTQQVVFLENGDAALTAQQEHHVAYHTTWYSGVAPVLLYLLGTVLLVPTLVILLQPFTCGFPFGGFSETAGGGCGQTPCWGNLHILLAVASGFLLLLLVNLILVWFPWRMHHDRTLERPADLVGVLAFILSRRVIKFSKAAKDLPVSADARFSEFHPKRLTSEHLLASVQRWKHRFEAHPRFAFLLALLAVKFAVAWAGVVLGRSNTLAALLVAALALTAFATWTALRSQQTFVMRRLAAVTPWVYGVAAATAWLLLVAWSVAPPVVVNFASDSPSDLDFSQDEVAVDADAFALAETADMHAAGEPGIIATALLWLACVGGVTAVVFARDRAAYARIPLFRQWEEAVGEGVDQNGAYDSLTAVHQATAATLARSHLTHQVQDILAKQRSDGQASDSRTLTVGSLEDERHLTEQGSGTRVEIDAFDFAPSRMPSADTPAELSSDSSSDGDEADLVASMVTDAMRASTAGGPQGSEAADGVPSVASSDVDALRVPSGTDVPLEVGVSTAVHTWDPTSASQTPAAGIAMRQAGGAWKSVPEGGGAWVRVGQQSVLGAAGAQSEAGTVHLASHAVQMGGPPAAAAGPGSSHVTSSWTMRSSTGAEAFHGHDLPRAPAVSTTADAAHLVRGKQADRADSSTTVIVRLGAPKRVNASERPPKVAAVHMKRVVAHEGESTTIQLGPQGKWVSAQQHDATAGSPAPAVQEAPLIRSYGGSWVQHMEEGREDDRLETDQDFGFAGSSGQGFSMESTRRMAQLAQLQVSPHKPQPTSASGSTEAQTQQDEAGFTSRSYAVRRVVRVSKPAVSGTPAAGSGAMAPDLASDEDSDTTQEAEMHLGSFAWEQFASQAQASEPDSNITTEHRWFEVGDTLVMDMAGGSVSDTSDSE